MKKPARAQTRKPVVAPALAAAARAEILRSVEAHLVAHPGTSLRRACAATGYKLATISRWRRAMQQHGSAGIVGKQATGRPKKYHLGADESRALRALRLERGSLALAIEEFPAHPQCSPSTREAILSEMDAAAAARRRPRWPLSLRRAGWVTQEEHALARGNKAFQSIEHCDRRSLTIELPDGSRIPLAANTLFESDDMSMNEPFRYLDPESSTVRIGRQTLCTMDVFSAAWLGTSPIGRERDAYRLEDIADHISDIIHSYGLPMVWRFERGPWENTFIDGVRQPDGSHWGGLDGLCHVVHAPKSRGKGLIESSFDLLQSLMAHASTSIGRKRGEFERQTRHYLRAVKGDPRSAAAFWDIAAAADGMRDAMERFNARPKQRRAHGAQTVVPDDLYRDAVRRDVPAGEGWRLLPVKKSAIVRRGHIETTAPHYPLPFCFTVNGVEPGLYLEHGYAVLIAFHPGRPEEGCHIFNAQNGPRNRDRHRFGAPLLVAPLSADAPQLSLSKHEREALARKHANAAVRSEFRSVARAGGLNITKRISTGTSRDGWGNRAERVETPQSESPSRGARGASKVPTRADYTAAELAHLERSEADLLAEAGIFLPTTNH